MAPEIIGRGAHSYPCDLWSLGITLYVMLSGNYPFDFNNIEHEILQGLLIFKPLKDWENISWHAKGLIQHLLDKDPNKRITAKDALDHPWFTTEVDQNEEEAVDL